MSQRPDATPEVARARRYAARVRILIALAGGLLLTLEPELAVHLWPAAIGFAVIGLTGLVEWYVHDERWLRVEEALSCVAVICMVGLSGGRVNVVSVLWLVAAAAGVLARGGRVGGVGRVVVVGVLLSPLVIEGERSLESVGFAVGAIALFLATGRISRETTELLRRARHDAAHDPLTGLLLARGLPRPGGRPRGAGDPRAAGRADRARPRRLRRREQALRTRRRRPRAGGGGAPDARPSCATKTCSGASAATSSRRSCSATTPRPWPSA